MTNYIHFYAAATCPACGQPHRVAIDCPISLSPNDDVPLEFEVGDELSPIDVPWVTGRLQDAHAGSGNLERGRALFEWWCPGCSDYRWVIVTLDTLELPRPRRRRAAVFTALEITVPENAVPESVDWYDGDIDKALADQH